MLTAGPRGDLSLCSDEFRVRQRWGYNLGRNRCRCLGLLIQDGAGAVRWEGVATLITHSCFCALFVPLCVKRLTGRASEKLLDRCNALFFARTLLLGFSMHLEIFHCNPKIGAFGESCHCAVGTPYNHSKTARSVLRSLSDSACAIVEAENKRGNGH